MSLIISTTARIHYTRKNLGEDDEDLTPLLVIVIMILTTGAMSVIIIVLSTPTTDTSVTTERLCLQNLSEPGMPTATIDTIARIRIPGITRGTICYNDVKAICY